MAKSKSVESGLGSLKNAISSGEIGNLYIFHGEERYLLEFYIGQIKKKLLDEGTAEFNYKKINGKTATVSEISQAVDALPVFAERTLIEIDDFDIFKSNESVKNELIELFSDVPEYACVIFVYDTVEFKPDGRVKINQNLKKLFTVVEFESQDQNDLINWISRRFRALDKTIDRRTADYMIFVCGSLMTKLITEIEKTAAYSKENEITKEDIDAVVIPQIDAVTYKMTNAVVAGKYGEALDILSDLFAQGEPPHKIIYSVSLRIRQMYSAWVCIEKGRGLSDLMDMLNLKNDYQARSLMKDAKYAGEQWCRKSMELCAEAALKLNSSSFENDDILAQLIIDMALAK